MSGGTSPATVSVTSGILYFNIADRTGRAFDKLRRYQRLEECIRVSSTRCSGSAGCWPFEV